MAREVDPPGSQEQDLHNHSDQEHESESEITDERAGLTQGTNGIERPDQTVFDLSMDYSDDDVLLDWEQYAGLKRLRCCGCDWTWLSRCLPCLPWVPPAWWYKYSRKQRRALLFLIGLASTLIALTVLVIAVAENSSLWGSGIDLASHPQCNWRDFRLPNSTVPVEYHLRLKTQTEDPYTVTGSLDIDLHVMEETPCIVLHASAMEIKSVKLNHGPAAKWELVRDLEQLIVWFGAMVPMPNATLSLEFTYPLAEGLSGFYRSTYEDDDGVDQTLATTQFESASARKAFPCFDEPAYKAKYHVKLTVPTGLVALSNMPEVAYEQLPDGFTLHEFAVSPPMSSYLVAFVVGDLRSVSQTLPHPSGGPDRPITVWGTPARREELRTALDIAVRTLPAYEAMLGVPYALPKLDLVAIPDFAAGAMENWGLITYRETALLVSETSSTEDSLYIGIIIAHEMAHLWFGDLVTCEYWNELWLNEGFASYFEYVAADLARTDFHYFDYFYSDVTTSALYLDSKNSSNHALASDPSLVQSVQRIESLFDDITYEKGGSLLRMLRTYMNRDNPLSPNMRRRRLLQGQLTGDTFLAGLRHYLQQRQNSTATSAQLWSALSEGSGVDVTVWMAPWTYQAGFPLVTVSLSEDGAVFVDQAPFTITGTGVCGGENGSTPWWIPLAFVTREDNRNPQWQSFDECRAAAPLGRVQGEQDWFKLNAGQSGVYRVNYPPRLWERLAAAAEETRPDESTGMLVGVLGSADLAGLLDDSWALATTGLVDVTHFLELSRSLGKRRAVELAPWSVAAGHFGTIRRLLAVSGERPECLGLWGRYVRELVTEPMIASVETGNGLGMELNTTLDRATTEVQLRLLRPTVFAVAGEVNDTLVLEEAATAFTQAQEDRLQVDPDMRRVVYDIAVASGNPGIFEAMKARYLTALDADEEERALAALGHTPLREKVRELLAMTLQPDVRAMDIKLVVEVVASRGGDSLRAAWDFVKAHLRDFYVKLGKDEEASSRLGKIASGVASRFATSDALTEVEALWASHRDILKEERHRITAQEGIQAHIQWLQHNAGPACDWLQRTLAA